MKFLIVGHHDADGSTGIAVIKRAIDRRVENVREVDIVVDNLSTPIDWSKYTGYDVVFIVDHPYVPELENGNTRIVWLDHHVSAFGDDRNDIQGIRSASMAGCELAWLFMEGSVEDIEYVEKYPKDSRQDKRISEIRAKAPAWVRIVGDADNWDHAMRSKIGDNAWKLFLAANAIPGIKEKDPEDPDPCLRWTNLISIFIPVDDFTGEVVYDKFKDLIDYGASVARYQATNNARLVKDNLIEASIKGLPGAKVALLNTSARGSSTFDSVKDKYDIGGVFVYNGEGKVTTNFYSLKGKDDYDLSVIAKKYGGGGHKGAAGCTVNKIDDIFVIRDKKKG